MFSLPNGKSDFSTVSGGTGAHTFNWGGGVNTQNRIGLSTGPYTVKVTDQAGCQGTATFTIAVTGLTGPAADLSGICFYPNPSSGSVMIRAVLANGEVTLHVFNAIGQLVLSKSNGSKRNDGNHY